MDELTKYQDELWQIIRFHASDVIINIEVSPCGEGLAYYLKMKVEDLEFSTYGVRLWKRYADMIKILNKLYGENLHIYGAKIKRDGSGK